MKGIQAYDISAWHPLCTNIQIVDIAGFAHVYCPSCRILANMQAMCPKFASKNDHDNVVKERAGG